MENSSNMCNLCRTFREPKVNSKTWPLVSDSNFFGPSIDENIIYLISFLPNVWLKKIGFFHENQNDDSNVRCVVDLEKWLKGEYMCLAKEVADCGMNINERGGPYDSQMIESRRFVLNRLAELMEKKTELERGLNSNNGATTDKEE